VDERERSEPPEGGERPRGGAGSPGVERVERSPESQWLSGIEIRPTTIIDADFDPTSLLDAAPAGHAVKGIVRSYAVSSSVAVVKRGRRSFRYDVRY